MMDKQYIRYLLEKAFLFGDNYGAHDTTGLETDYRVALKIKNDFEVWLNEEIDALDYL